jgi:oligopeptide transport system substrate-binding protein
MKRHNQRGRLIVALLLALILPILAACGGGQPSAEAPAASPVPAASAPDATQAPASTQATAAPEAGAPATAVPAADAPTTGGSGDGKLRIAASLGTWPDTIAPQKASFSNEIAILLLNYEGLTRFDKDLKTVPAAAEKWEYNQDATQVTFHLRDGLKYSDGSPLTAQDFVLAVYRTLDPHNPGDYQTALSMIKGAEAIINTEVPTDEAKLADLDKALGVKATDDKTLVFDLSQPTPYFHTLAGTWVIFPAKQDLIDKGGEQWYEDPANQIGNGPFQIASIDKAANLITFKANENYWAGKPKLDAVEFTYIQDLSVALQAYKSDEVDIIVPDPNDVPTIKADPVLGKEYKEYAGACTRTVTFNLTKPPFDNKKVREAFAYAFDREGYVRDALKDTDIPTLTWIPPGYPGNDPSETRYNLDPAKAKQLLAEAGYPNGEGLPEIKYAYGSNNPANQPRAEYIAQMYQKNLGISIIPDPIENTTLVNMRKDVATFPQSTAGGWCADYPDPQNWLSIYWHSSTTFAKNTGYINPEVDKLLEQADIEVDATKRAQMYDQAQKIMIGDVAEVMRSVSKNYFLIKPYVKGLDFTPQDSDYAGEMTSLFNVTVEK